MTEGFQISDDTSLWAQARANVSLARALVRDAHTAEDVAQDAWVAWLSAPVQRSSEWLRGALRNLARRSHRDRQRQAQVPQPSATSSPPTDEVVAQVAMQRDIADALLAIGEPYRTVLVLRFWHDLPPRYGKWKSAHKRFTRWARAGVWQRIFAALTSDPDNDYLMLDSTLVRAHQQAATGKGGAKIRLWGVPEAG